MSATSDDLNPVVTAIEMGDFDKLKRAVLNNNNSSASTADPNIAPSTTSSSSSSASSTTSANTTPASTSSQPQQPHLYNAIAFFQPQSINSSASSGNGNGTSNMVNRYYAIFVGNAILSGEKLNVYQQQRLTALHLCVKYNRLDMAKFLVVENGANVNAQAKMLEYQYRDKLNAYVECDVRYH